MSRILYSGTKNASSWAFRAWLALKEMNIEFEERVTAHARELDPWPLTRAWTDRLIARETVQQWLQEARAQPVVRLAGYLPAGHQ